MYVSIPTIIHSYWDVVCFFVFAILDTLSLILAVCLFKICPELSLEWGMKKELCEPQMLFQCLSFSPVLLALSATL